MADDRYYLVGEDTTIHVYEGMSCVEIYEKDDKVPTFVTGFHRLDNELDGPKDRSEAVDRIRDIVDEVNELREHLITLNKEFTSSGERIEKLLNERDDLTYRFELAGEEFNRLYLKKKESIDKLEEEDLVKEPPKKTYGPNYKESQFRYVTEEMTNLYLRKNADYGDSFTESLDEDGLLVSKIRMNDKFKRFSQLINNDVQIDDETMEDTLIDLANYTVMTLMWIRDNE